MESKHDLRLSCAVYAPQLYTPLNVAAASGSLDILIYLIEERKCSLSCLDGVDHYYIMHVKTMVIEPWWSTWWRRMDVTLIQNIWMETLRGCMHLLVALTSWCISLMRISAIVRWICVNIAVSRGHQDLCPSPWLMLNRHSLVEFCSFLGTVPCTMH